MVDRWEELRNVKGHHTCLETLGPSGSHQMCQDHPCILGRVLSHTSNLVQVENIVLDAIESETVGYHLLNEFAEGVQQHNGLEHLGSGVGRLARLRNDDQQAVLKVR